MHSRKHAIIYLYFLAVITGGLIALILLGSSKPIMANENSKNILTSERMQITTTKYLTPTLLYPEHGFPFNTTNAPVILQWESNEELTSDEYYEIDLWHTETSTHTIWTQAITQEIQMRFSPGPYWWQVRIVKMMGGVWQEDLSPTSKKRAFIWSPITQVFPTATPTPSPTSTPVPTPSPTSIPTFTPIPTNTPTPPPIPPLKLEITNISTDQYPNIIFDVSAQDSTGRYPADLIGVNFAVKENGHHITPTKKLVGPGEYSLTYTSTLPHDNSNHSITLLASSEIGQAFIEREFSWKNTPRGFFTPLNISIGTVLLTTIFGAGWIVWRRRGKNNEAESMAYIPPNSEWEESGEWGTGGDDKTVPMGDPWPDYDPPKHKLTVVDAPFQGTNPQDRPTPRPGGWGDYPRYESPPMSHDTPDSDTIYPYPTTAGKPSPGSQLEFSMPRLNPRDPIDDYVILGEVTRGEGYIIYRAVYRKDDKTFALKVIREGDTPLSKSLSRRLRREALLLQPLDHPNIVKCSDMGSEGDHEFIVLEYVNDTLKSFSIPLKVPEVIKYAKQIATGLKYLQSQGIIHRDIKPSNILLLKDEQKVKISGFGLSNEVIGDIEGNQSIGTPRYRAPELALGEIDKSSPRTDVYSFALVLYELLTGTLPFRSTEQKKMDLYQAHVPPEPPSKYNPYLTEEIDTVILRGLEKEPAKRFSNAEAMVDALQDAWEWCQTQERIIATLKPSILTSHEVPQQPPEDILSGDELTIATHLQNVLQNKIKSVQNEVGNTAPKKFFGSGNRWALLVGANYYEDWQNYGELQVCVQDVEEIHKQLLLSGFSAERIHLLTDNTEDLPKRASIITRLQSIANAAEEDDLLLFYYSGHGDHDREESYLVAQDGTHLSLSDTAIAISRVKEIMRFSEARAKVIVIDACHAGAKFGKDGPKSMSPEFIERVFEQAQGMAILASCKKEERSYEWEEKSRSVFTHYLLEALQGHADQGEKGFITVKDTSDYVTNGVKLWASRSKVSQTPTLEYKVSGDIIIANYNTTNHP